MTRASRLIAPLVVFTVVAAASSLPTTPAAADTCTYDAGTKTVTFPPGAGIVYGEGPICTESLDQIGSVDWPGTIADETFRFDVVNGTFSPAALQDPDGISEVKFELDAGGGSDTIELYGLTSLLGYDFVFSNGGLDLNGDGDVDVTIVNAEHLKFRLGTGDDTIDASAGVPPGIIDATIEDGPGSDTVTGGPEDDWLNPWDGDDAFSGGAGDDTVDVMGFNGSHFDLGSWQGGSDEDTLLFEQEVIADLGAGTVRASGGFPPSMTFAGFEDLKALSVSTLIGDDGTNVLEAGQSGVLRGGGGSDTLISDNGAAVADFEDAIAVSVDLVAGTATGDGDDTLVGIQNVFGSLGDDTIVGDDDHPGMLFGEAGDDAIIGGSFEDLLAGGPGKDDLRGRDGLDDLHGGPGHDLLLGAAGADDLFGGRGNDDVRGGSGEDAWDAYLYSVAEPEASPTAGVSVNLRRGIVSDDGYGGTDAIAAIENASGTDFADTMVGNAGRDRMFGWGGKDRFVGGAGDDRFDGGAGRDTVSYTAATRSLDLDLAAGTATGMGDDVLENIEVVFGGPKDDVVRGSGGRERLEGRGGNDHLFGRAGDDRLLGGAGADEMAGGEGVDTCNGGAGSLDAAKACETVRFVP